MSMAGKARWAEKTPQNIRHLDWILARFPRASVVHIIRDGRDVVCSMREHPDWRWRDGAWQKVIVDRPLAWYAQRWLADTAAGMAWREDPRYVEVRYEDLVADPTAIMRTVSDAIGEPAEDDWLASVGERTRAQTTQARTTTGLSVMPRSADGEPGSAATSCARSCGSARDASSSSATRSERLGPEGSGGRLHHRPPTARADERPRALPPSERTSGCRLTP